MSEPMAVDANGTGLAVDDTVTLRATVIGGAGGDGVVVIRLIDPVTGLAREGEEQLDQIQINGELLATGGTWTP